MPADLFPYLRSALPRRLTNFSAIFGATLIFGLCSGLVACGGGSSTTTPTSIVITANDTSLDFTNVVTFSAVAQNSASPPANVSGQKITFTSSNTGVVTLGNPVTATDNTTVSVAVCGGIFDSSFAVCNPGQAGSSVITATVVTGSTTITSTVTVYVHPRVDTVNISPASVNCLSQGGTQQYSATAISAGKDITSQVGPFTWQAANPSVVSFSTDVNHNGLATAAAPGATSVTAIIASTSSSPASFTTCGVKSIVASVPNSTSNTFSLTTTATTQQLSAVVTDTAGTVLSNVPLTWTSSQPASLTMSSSSTGLLTANAPGTSAIVASCAGTSCNVGLPPIYSNVITGSVSGSSTPVAYAAGSNSTSLVPIGGSPVAAGNTITLPYTPNSIMWNRAGAKLYLGSSSVVMVYDPVANTVSLLNGVAGTIAAISPDGTRMILYNNNTVGILNIPNNTFEVPPFSVSTTPVRASFTPDGSKAYIVAGNTLFIYSLASALRSISLSAPANDVSFLTQGSFAYVAGGTGNTITALTTCNNSQADVQSASSAPVLISTTPDSAHVVAVEKTQIDELATATNGIGCPPALTDTPQPAEAFGATVTPRQLLVLPNSSKAYVLSDQPGVFAYDVTQHTVTNIPLAGGATPFSGGYTLDGANLFVGGSDNNVHRIDTNAGSDAQQISVGFTPDLVAVRPL